MLRKAEKITDGWTPLRCCVDEAWASPSLSIEHRQTKRGLQNRPDRPVRCPIEGACSRSGIWHGAKDGTRPVADIQWRVG